MSSPLDVTCPVCNAHPGERCWRHGAPGASHAERRAPAVRERRPYDVEPLPVLEPWTEPEEPSPRERDGRVVHELDDRARAVGLAGLAQARAVLAQHRRARAPEPGP